MKLKSVKAADVVILIIMIICALLCLIPIWNTVCISFSDRTAVNQGIVGFWPVNFTVASYKAMLSDRLFWNSFGVSVKRVIIGTALNVLLCVS